MTIRNFLADPIYDWLNFPDAVLEVCDNIQEEKNQKSKIKSYNYSTTTTI